MQLTFKYLLASFQTAVVLLLLISGIRAAGEVDLAFNPAAVEVRTQNGSDVNAVNRIAVQPDGKIIAVGSFQTADKLNRNGIVRLTADGTVDTSFVPAAVYYTQSGVNFYGRNISAVALQPDGKILIGGLFSGVGSFARPGIARLNADGSVDTTFDVQRNGATLNGGGAGLNATILDVKVGADGKITFAGQFVYTAGTARYAIARVNADGSADTTFNAPSNFTLSTVAWRVETLSDGKTLIAGITQNTPAGVGFVQRLNANGTLDSTFASVSTSDSIYGFNGITALRLQPDGKILAGGSFARVNGFPLNGLVRLNADGTIDTSFSTSGAGPNSQIYDIELTADNMVLVGGYFSTYNGVNRLNVALLDQTGNLSNQSYNSGAAPREVKDLAILPDGKILTGAPVPLAALSPALTRLNADGTVDTTFNLVLANSSTTNRVLVQPDGKILLGGSFTHVNKLERRNITRLNADGTPDTTFNSPAIPQVYNLDVRADGDILVAAANVYRLDAGGTQELVLGLGNAFDAKFLPGGGFISAANFRLRKYTESGTLASGFDVATNNNIRRIVPQPDGKFIVVGDFTTIGGQTRGRIARINADGTVDTTFNPPGGANSTIFDAVVQTDGKIIIGGIFSGFNFNANYKYLARLDADGSLDTTFNPIIEGGVQSLRLQPNGKILVGGAMYAVNGIARQGIVRLNPDGTLDAAFNAGANNSVLSIDLQPGGKIVLGGTFTFVNNIDRLGVARLLDAATRNAPFDFDGDGKADISVFRPSTATWYLQHSGSGFAAYNFGQTSDLLAPADYDGDGRTDVAVYRNGTWHLLRSTLGVATFPFGAAGDIPVPADYDGDGKADIAVYRPSSGTWYIQGSQAGFSGVAFGASEDKPAVGDYDGDGKADIAVFRPSNGVWYIQRSIAGFTGIAFGQSGDLIVPADYDGDGKSDVAVYRAGIWYLQRSQLGFTGIAFGQSGDFPVAADYDGDGKADVAVFRDGNWYLQRSSQGFIGVTFGAAIDKPIPNAFVQ